MCVGYWIALMLSFALAAAFLLTAVGFLPYTIAGQIVPRHAWWRISPILPVVSAYAAEPLRRDLAVARAESDAGGGGPLPSARLSQALSKPRPCDRA